MEEKQTILVIGANRGIGNQLTKRLLDKGHDVWGTYRPATKNEDDSVKELISSGAKTLELDVADEESVVKAAKTFDEQTMAGGLDILVHVAGIYQINYDDKPFMDHTVDDMMTYFRINTVGPFLTSKHFLPALSRSPMGRIINVSSDMASIEENTVGGNACYRLSKSALNSLTRTQSCDLVLRASNVITLAVHPGYVATKMTGFYGEDDMDACMSGLCETVLLFGREGEGKEGGEGGARLRNGGYVRWDGRGMRW